jgi:hypothetical protein
MKNPGGVSPAGVFVCGVKGQQTRKAGLPQSLKWLTG